MGNISWTTDGTADTTNSPMDLPCMPPESSFQPEHGKTKHSIVLQDADIPQITQGDYLPYLNGNAIALFSSHLWMLEEQIFSKWISQPQDHQYMQTIPNFIKVSKVCQGGNVVVRKMQVAYPKASACGATRVIIDQKSQTLKFSRATA